MGSRPQLGDLEELVLLAVLRLGEEAYGAAIREELKARADRAPTISTIYVTLMRMEDKGYVASRMGEPTRERGGKAKRYFRMEAEGMKALETARQIRERMWEGLKDQVNAHVR